MLKKFILIAVDDIYCPSTCKKNYVIDLRFEVQRQQMLFKKRLARAVDESDDVEKNTIILWLMIQ